MKYRNIIDKLDALPLNPGGACPMFTEIQSRALLTAVRNICLTATDPEHLGAARVLYAIMGDCWSPDGSATYRDAADAIKAAEARLTPIPPPKFTDNYQVEQWGESEPRWAIVRDQPIPQSYEAAVRLLRTKAVTSNYRIVRVVHHPEA